MPDGEVQKKSRIAAKRLLFGNFLCELKVTRTVFDRLICYNIRRCCPVIRARRDTALCYFLTVATLSIPACAAYYFRVAPRGRTIAVGLGSKGQEVALRFLRRINHIG
ncbi:hypothetical protein [Pseudomonas sp.]|uniref:hypothetical protein n=1 Tax=Pseudomonas sp. TaxID=306 RepID=UPI0028AC0BE3|nr:hypothetical protein [Pseudomonas sp.]